MVDHRFLEGVRSHCNAQHLSCNSGAELVQRFDLVKRIAQLLYHIPAEMAVKRVSKFGMIKNITSLMLVALAVAKVEGIKCDKETKLEHGLPNTLNRAR